MMATRISGADSNSSGKDGRRFERNLSFESNIRELSIMPEINLAFLNKNSFWGKFSGFLYGGVAVFSFDPTTQFQGETVRLQPLGTEGQGIFGNEEKYALTQISIPMGAGLKIFLNDRWTVTIEGSARKTFTDHLDDVSTSYVENLDQLISTNGTLAGQLSSRRWEYLNAQCNCDDFTPANSYPTSERGEAGNDDWYLTAGITVSYKLRDLDFSRKGKGGCPNNF